MLTGNFAGGDYYIRHPDDKEIELPKDLTAEQLGEIVNKAAVSNEHRRLDAIRKADSYSYRTAHPELKNTERNTKIINHWIASKGIKYPTFADFDAAVTELSTAQLLDVDEAKKNPNGPFVGVLTKRTFNSLEELIQAERDVAIQQNTVISDEEKALNNLPIEQAQALLREGERHNQSVAQALETKKECDSWITLHPEYTDSVTNGRLMHEQLRLNGVEGPASIEDLERAHQQLRAANLLQLNKGALEKQQAEEVRQRAQRAVKTPGSIFDTTTETEMYNLPMEELRRRASGNYSGY